MNDKEPTTPKGLTSTIWSCANAKTKKNVWNFQPRTRRGKVAELSPVIKPVAFGSKIYKMGAYTGTLDELKEFAAMKGLARLCNGAISYKTA